MLNILVDPSEERKIVDFRLLGMNDIMVLGRYNYAYAHERLPIHSHGALFEFHLLDEGVQPHIIADEEYILNGGDVLIVFPFEEHSSGSNPENRGRAYWLLVRVPEKDEGFLNLSVAESQILTNTLYNLSPRHFKGNKFLKFYLEKMIEAYDSGGELMRAEIKNWALRFVLEVVHDNRRYASKQTSPLINESKAYIENNLYEESIPLSQIASFAGLSLSRFKARFKHEVGVSPGNYMNLRKIEKAKERLTESNDSITHIAMDLGFTTSQYFATTFKRYTGHSPRSFRNQLIKADIPNKKDV
jgi:AraC-like DNA-binding protein